MCATPLVIPCLEKYSKSRADTLTQSDGPFLIPKIKLSGWKTRELCWEKEMREPRGSRTITGAIRMSSLLLRCLRREPSAGEIVPQIRSEARLQCRGLQLRNRSNTNRGQSKCLTRALPPTQQDTTAKGKKSNADVGRYTWSHTKKHIYAYIKSGFWMHGVRSNEAVAQDK